MWNTKILIISAVSIASELVINLPGLGSLTGVSRNGADQFYGVPYAKIAKKFEHSTFPPEPWINRDARSKQSVNYPICIQPNPGNYNENTGEYSAIANKEQSEDCLYLQIATPTKRDNNTLLPVLLFFHGGGFQTGSNIASPNDASYFAAKTNTIVIFANYRLNVFGFLAAEADYNGYTSFGNFGLVDQENAMRFVFENVKYFGGDNNRITIGGDSAGGESVRYQTLRENSLVQNYYSKAVMISNPIGLGTLTKQEAKILKSEVIKNAGCDSIECLKTKSSSEIVKAAQATLPAGIGTGNMINAVGNHLNITAWVQKFGPVIDHTIVFSSMMPEKETFKKPILVGVTSDEAASQAIEIFGENIYNTAVKIWFNNPDQSTLQNKQKKDKILAAFPWTSDCSRFYNNVPGDCNGFDAMIRLVTDYVWTCPLRKAVADMNTLSEKAFFYNFREPEIWSDPANAGKNRCEEVACHEVDLRYVFDKIAQNQNEDSSKTYSEWRIYLTRLMQNYYANFIRTGDPNSYDGWVETEFSNDMMELPSWGTASRGGSWGYLEIPNRTKYGKGEVKFVVNPKEYNDRCSLLDSIDEYTEH